MYLNEQVCTQIIVTFIIITTITIMKMFAKFVVRK